MQVSSSIDTPAAVPSVAGPPIIDTTGGWKSSAAARCSGAASWWLERPRQGRLDLARAGFLMRFGQRSTMRNRK